MGDGDGTEDREVDGEREVGVVKKPNRHPWRYALTRFRNTDESQPGPRPRVPIYFFFLLLIRLPDVWHAHMPGRV